MTDLRKIEFHPDVINYFKELCNIYIEKPKIKRLKNIDLLSDFPFHTEWNVVKTDQAFKGYAMSHKVELV